MTDRIRKQLRKGHPTTIMSLHIPKDINEDLRTTAFGQLRLATQETHALCKILGLGNQDLAAGRVAPFEEVKKRIQVEGRR